MTTEILINRIRAMLPYVGGFKDVCERIQGVPGEDLFLCWCAAKVAETVQPREPDPE